MKIAVTTTLLSRKVQSYVWWIARHELNMLMPAQTKRGTDHNIIVYTCEHAARNVKFALHSLKEWSWPLSTFWSEPEESLYLWQVLTGTRCGFSLDCFQLRLWLRCVSTVQQDRTRRGKLSLASSTGASVVMWVTAIVARRWECSIAAETLWLKTFVTLYIQFVSMILLKGQCHDIQWFFALFCASKQWRLLAQMLRTSDHDSSVSRANNFTAQAKSSKYRSPRPRPYLVAAIIFPHTTWLPKITDYRDTADLTNQGDSQKRHSAWSLDMQTLLSEHCRVSPLMNQYSRTHFSETRISWWTACSWLKWLRFDKSVTDYILLMINLLQIIFY